MKRASLIYSLFLCLTAAPLMSQANSAPEISRNSAIGLERSASLDFGSLFSPAVNFSFSGIGSTPTSVAIGDVNGDGKADLIVAFIGWGPGNQGLIAVLLGNGDGTFRFFDSFGSGAGFANSVKIADLNGDGRLDLVVSNCGSTDDPGDCPNEKSDGVVAIFLGNGDGTFHAPVLYDSGGGQALAVEVADLNLDGKPDVLVQNGCADPACAMGGGFGVMLGNGDGTFQPAVAYNGYGRNSMAVADLNGDGKPDLLLGSGTRSVTVLLGNGDGTFAFSQSLPLHDFEVDAAAADFDGDGILDIVTLTSGKGAYYLSVLKGNADGTYQPEERHPKFRMDAYHLAIADVNSDGVPAVVVSGIQQHSLDGELMIAPGFYASGGEGSFSVAVGDLNGDGRLDLVTPDFWTNDIGILLNIGPYPTSVLLTSSLNPALKGQAVTFTATIGSAGNAPPDGEIVTFKKGKNVLGQVPLSGGTATLTTSKLKVGTTAITALYGGDSHFASRTSNTVEQVVNKK